MEFDSAPVVCCGSGDVAHGPLVAGDSNTLQHPRGGRSQEILLLKLTCLTMAWAIM